MSTVKTNDAGSFNRFLTVETKNEVADGFGGFLKFYEARNSVWAHVKPVRGARNLRADKDTMEITHRILIRFHQEIDRHCRFITGTRKFDILAIRDADETRRYLECDCVEWS